VINFLFLLVVYQQGVRGNKRYVGVETFSGFTGWAKANNATSILPYVEVDTTKFKDKMVLRIHQICKAYPDSFFKMDYVRKTAFMWYKQFPGKAVLMEYYYNQNQQVPYVKCWSLVGIKMNEYADELIKQHPIEFTRRFILWNCGELFLPMNNFEKYPNVKPDKYTKEWFKINEPLLHARRDIFQKYFSKFTYFKYVFFMFLGLLSILILAVKKKDVPFNKSQTNTVYVLSFFVIITSLFLVISHPIHLRYVVMFTTVYSTLFYILVNKFKKINKQLDGKN
jgi:hypothetical protein